MKTKKNIDVYERNCDFRDDKVWDKSFEENGIEKDEDEPLYDGWEW